MRTNWLRTALAAGFTASALAIGPAAAVATPASPPVADADIGTVQPALLGGGVFTCASWSTVPLIGPIMEFTCV